MSATGSDDLAHSNIATVRMYAALVWAGLRRYATYRQAMLAAIFTNSVFGFLRCFVVLSAAAGAGGVAAGYPRDRLATYIWAGQGLLGTVLLWVPSELAERIRSGDVVVDLVRPVNPVWRELAGDLGRGAYSALTRFAVPVAVGAVAFDLYAPSSPITYPVFALSVVLGLVICFGCRYIVAACAYWMLDARGPTMMWTLLSATLSGLTFPLWFLPHELAVGLLVGTPFPSIVQAPLDILTERGTAAARAGLLALQGAWAAVMVVAAHVVQRRAERRLVIQGG